VPVIFALAKKRTKQTEFIERKMPRRTQASSPGADVAGTHSAATEKASGAGPGLAPVGRYALRYGEVQRRVCVGRDQGHEIKRFMRRVLSVYYFVFIAFQL
jgi:hypothetical protein